MLPSHQVNVVGPAEGVPVVSIHPWQLEVRARGRPSTEDRAQTCSVAGVFRYAETVPLDSFNNDQTTAQLKVHEN